MRKLENFEFLHRQAMNYIENLTHPCGMEPPMDGLVRWMLTTDASPYDYLDDGWHNSEYSSAAFESLLQTIRHALYDDGDITFITIDTMPKIVFIDRHDLETVRPEWFTKNLQILSISPNEFGPLFDVWFSSKLKKCFMADARRGIAWTVKHYSRYQLWNPEWENEAYLKYGESK